MRPSPSPQPSVWAWLPHFSAVDFQGEFPLAELSFRDDTFPGDVKMLAFNPFIPTNEDDSSIPAAFFEFSISNTTDGPLTSSRNPLRTRIYRGEQ